MLCDFAGCAFHSERIHVPKRDRFSSSVCALPEEVAITEQKVSWWLLTPTVDMVAGTGLCKAIDVIAFWACFDIHRGVPEAAVPVEGGTSLPLNNAI